MMQDKQRQIPKLTAKNKECYLSVFSCAGVISAYKHVMCPDSGPAGMLSPLRPGFLTLFPRFVLPSSHQPLLYQHPPSCFPPQIQFTEMTASLTYSASQRQTMSYCPFVYTLTQSLPHKMFAFVFRSLIVHHALYSKPAHCCMSVEALGQKGNEGTNPYHDYGHLLMNFIHMRWIWLIIIRR